MPDTGVIGPSVTSWLGIPRRATKRSWGPLVDTAGVVVSVRSGLDLVGKFHFRNPATGKPVGVLRVWCSEVLVIVGSVLGLIAALRGALLDMPVGVTPVFSLSALLPGCRAIVVGLPACVDLPACVGPPVNADLFVETLS